MTDKDAQQICEQFNSHFGQLTNKNGNLTKAGKDLFIYLKRYNFEDATDIIDDLITGWDSTKSTFTRPSVGSLIKRLERVTPQTDPEWVNDYNHGDMVYWRAASSYIGLVDKSNGRTIIYFLADSYKRTDGTKPEWTAICASDVSSQDIGRIRAADAEIHIDEWLSTYENDGFYGFCPIHVVDRNMWPEEDKAEEVVEDLPDTKPDNINLF